MMLLLHMKFSLLRKVSQLLKLLKDRISQVGKSCMKPILRLHKYQDRKGSYCPLLILGWGTQNQLDNLSIG
jgi:hypothetical protein